jgi:hypothetical protein
MVSPGDSCGSVRATSSLSSYDAVRYADLAAQSWTIGQDKQGIEHLRHLPYYSNCHLRRGRTRKARENTHHDAAMVFKSGFGKAGPLLDTVAAPGRIEVDPASCSAFFLLIDSR